MSDVVVTVPKWFGLDTWIAEGDAAGEPWSGQLWDFYLWGSPPTIGVGDRVYVVYNGKLRGYAPLTKIIIPKTFLARDQRYSLQRGGDAVAVTIDEPIRGFRGFRYRWWDRSLERPFPDWRQP